MTISIVKAKPSDVKNVHKIMDSCTKWLSDKNLNHWIGAYPLKKIKERINKNITYLIKEGQKPVGTITLTKERPFYHTGEDDQYWGSPKAKAMYITGLAVSPEYMKKGYAMKLIEYAENKAKQENIKYLRFDAVSHYKDLIKFYKNRGCEIVQTKTTFKKTSSIGEYGRCFFEKYL